MTKPLGTPTRHAHTHTRCEPVGYRCTAVFSGAYHPTHALSFPSHILIFLAALPRLTDACLIGRGHGVFYSSPDSQEVEPTMLPPYGHAAFPAPYEHSSPLDMPHYLFTHLWNCVDAIEHAVDRGHGTGPWDDVRRVIVDRPTLLQSEFWPHLATPLHEY